MTRVRKAAAVALMTPLAATAIAISGNTNAQAAGCVGFSTATITPPSGPVLVGSSVVLKATVHNMLLQAHLQISGPGLNQQVGKSAFNGDIGDSITVSQPGRFSLAVIGNGTHCTYVTSGFTVKAQSASPKPTHGSTPRKTLLPGHGGVRVPGSSSPFPGITPGTGGAGFVQRPLDGSSPFNLPPVAPDGSVPGFQYPTPDPQVASPPARPLAHNVSQTTPVKWGQSVAVALVLLLLSAHLGMLSRRQRLAAAGPHGPRGGKAGKAGGRKATRRASTAVTEASAPGTTAPRADTTDTGTRSGGAAAAGGAVAGGGVAGDDGVGDDGAGSAATTGGVTTGSTSSAASSAAASSAGGSGTAASSADATGTVGTGTVGTGTVGTGAAVGGSAEAGTGAAPTEGTDGEVTARDQTAGRRSSGRTYHGRRRRG